MRAGSFFSFSVVYYLMDEGVPVRLPRRRSLALSNVTVPFEKGKR